MILHPSPDGLLAIPQSAHALMAFQLADHWGNRLTPRPSPRAEVLAAVLLHDAGWDGREEPPRLTTDGRPVAFDTAADDERQTAWGSAVERAGLHGRYVAYLVSHHVSTLASFTRTQRFGAFLAVQEEFRTRMRQELATDVRCRDVFSTGADEVNRAVVRLSDAIAVYLARADRDALVLEGLPRRSGPASLSLMPAGLRALRVRPWPFVGRRLTVTTEGRLLNAERFPDEDALRRAWRQAATVRATWTLLSAGAPAD